MAGIHDRIIAKREQDAANRLKKYRVIPSRQIRSTDRSREERIAHEQVQDFSRSACAVFRASLDWLSRLEIDRQAHAARAVAGGVVWPDGEVAEAEHVSGGIEVIDRRRRLDAEAEQEPVTDGVLVQKQIVAMERHRHIERTLRCGDARDVVDVRMS